LLTPGSKLGHYKILAPIGAGGMGELYRAEDTRLGRHVAIKFVSEELSQDREALERFQREARAASALNHPHICTIHDIGEHEGRHFIVMELIEGQNLSQRMGGQPMPTEEVLRLGIQIADALEATHAHGIVHRDLKPGNVLVTRRGQAKLVDFGLAKLLPLADDATVGESLTEPQAAIGTPPYMAPEQVLGERVDTRTDIHALGCILYEMATGQRPFREKLASRLTDEILHKLPPAPRRLASQLPEELERIILKCLEKDPANRYQWVGKLRFDLEQLSSEPPPLAPVPAGREVEQRKQKRWRLLLSLTGALMAVIALLLGLNIGGVRDRLLGRTATPQIQSLAVLPLDNLSGDPEQEYFADGMTDTLITELSKIGALKIISRTSTMRYKQTDKSIPEIGRDLRVDAVVEGSVMRSGDRVRITAQLIDARTDKHLWAENYEGDLRDVFALQADVARAISKEIQITVTAQEQARLGQTGPVNPEAHEAYLKGRYHLEKWSAEGSKKAEEYFLQAIEIDPKYALPYVGLAETYTFGVPGLSAQELEAKQKAAVAKALELNPSLGEAHVALAQLKHSTDWDFAGAEREYKAAIELNPSYGPAHHQYSHFLMDMGRFDESLRESLMNLELDPLSPHANLHLGNHYLAARQYDLAIEQEKKTLQMDPNYIEAHRQLGQAYLGKRMYEQALAELKRAAELAGRGSYHESRLAHAYAVAGRRAEAEKLLREFLAREKQGRVSPSRIAVICAGLNDKDRAFEWLEKAYRERSSFPVGIKSQLEYDNLRADPRYHDLLKRVGLPPD
jgi:TolB-like protein/Flp pilus assembly protein TadD